MKHENDNIAHASWHAAFFFAAFGVCLRVLGPGDVIGYSTNLLVELFVFVGAAFWALHLALTRRIVWPSLPLAIIVGVFTLLSAISAFRAPNLQASIVTLVDWLACTVLFFLIVQLCSDRRGAAVFIHLLIASATVVALYGLFQYVYSLDVIAQQLEEKPVEALRQIGQPPDALPDMLARVKDKRVFSTFANPNSLAGFLLMSLAVTAGALIDSIRRSAASIAAAVGLLMALLWQAAGLVLTFSKGGFVTLAVMAAAFVALTVLPAIMRRHRAIVIAGAIVLALAAGVAGAVVISRVAAHGFGEESTGAEGSLRVRLGYWIAAGRMIIDHPLQGVGLGNFGDFYSQYKLAEAGEVQRAHNNYLQVAAEMGIPGLIAFCVLWGGFILSSLRLSHSPTPSLAPSPTLPLPPSPTLPVFLGLAAGLLSFIMVGTLLGSLETFASKAASLTAYALMAAAWLVAFAPGAAKAFAPSPKPQAPSLKFTRIGITVGIVGFLVHGLADFDLYVPGCVQTAWLLAGLAVVLSRGRSNESSNESPAPSAVMARGRQLEDSTCPYSRMSAAGAAAIVLPVIAFTMLLIAPGVGLVIRSFEAESLALEAKAILHDTALTQQKLDEATAMLERSVAANPLDDDAWYALGQAHERRWQAGGGKNAEAFHEAVRCFRTAARRNPGYSAPLFRIALAYRQAALFERRLLLQRVPWDASGRNTIELAAAELAAAHDAAGGDSGIPGAGGTTNVARDFLPYIWAARRAVASYPTNPHFRASLGEAYYLAGLKRQASGEYAKAIDYDKATTVKRLKLDGEGLRTATERAGGGVGL